MFSQKQYLSLQTILETIQPEIATQLNYRRPAMERVYALLEISSDLSEGTVQGEHRNKLGLKDKLTNIEVAIAKANKEAAQAYLHGTFLTGMPIFATVASRKNETSAAMITELTRRDQAEFNWVLQLDRVLSDVLDYNIGVAEVQWDYKRVNSITTRISEGSPVTGKVLPITYEGNSILRKDPYNSFYSQHCEPSEVHDKGTYSGYVEQTDYIGLKRRYTEWDSQYTYKANINDIFSSTCNNAIYKKLTLEKTDKVSPTNSWQCFWGNSSTIARKSSSGPYEIVTLYARLIPQEYLITELENKGMARVFKLIYVNGLIALAQPVLSGHDFLPLIVTQYSTGGEDKKSFVEYVAGMQDLATGLVTASLDSMRRAVAGGDRIYDPRMIDEKDINSPAPAKNIKVKASPMEKDLSRAIRDIPYEDRISGNFTSFMGLVQQLAQMTTGINPSAQGNFIKGNKTTTEFDTIMQNSQARLQLGAIKLEGTLFATIKKMIKLNYLLYAGKQTVADNSDSETSEISIDPEILRTEAPDYKMADGLMPSTKLANTEILTLALQTMQTIPELAAEYDTGGILISILKQQGLTDLESYKRTKEQRDEYLARSQQLAPTNGQA